MDAESVQNKKTVWILGAGFSKPLGGPLLDDLLTRTSVQVAATRYKDLSWIDDAQYLVELFEAGHRRGSSTFTFPSGGLWGDAEEFTDYVDSAAAAAGPSAASVLLGSLAGRIFPRSYDTSPASLRDLARRTIAAACCGFVRDANRSSETWQPYHDWSDALTAGDTVVTFNYDTVLENLDKGLRAPVPPGPGPTDRGPFALKLHGSVRWRHVGGPGSQEFEATGHDDFAVQCGDASELSLATPGASKRLLAGDLGVLWARAENAIHDADAVVFIGYRFPPTDALARSRILRALSGNTKSRLGVHVVLGPNTHEPDVVRLEAMLKFALRRAGREEAGTVPPRAGPVRHEFLVHVHPLWAQDFLTVWDRDLLFK